MRAIVKFRSGRTLDLDVPFNAGETSEQVADRLSNQITKGMIFVQFGSRMIFFKSLEEISFYSSTPEPSHD